jgi:mono/diheme cytochrome c family protein
MRLLVLALAFPLGCASAPKTAAPAPMAPPAPMAVPATLDEQVAAGAKTFDAACASCHGKQGQGIEDAPTIIGEKALWDFKDASELFTYVQKNMPPDGPGPLVQRDFWNLTAFLAHKNGWTGEGPLSAANAHSVRRAP